MDEAILDKEIERVYSRLSFLWREYGFKIRYFTRDFGMYSRGYLIGLENDVCKIILLRETRSKIEPIIKRVGLKSASFTPPGYSYLSSAGWYTLTDLIYWATGVEYEYEKDVDQELDSLSRYLKLYIEDLFDLLRVPSEFENKLERYRNLRKKSSITVDQIRAERARLAALGQDSSLEAAIKNLSGDKQ